MAPALSEAQPGLEKINPVEVRLRFDTQTMFLLGIMVLQISLLKLLEKMQTPYYILVLYKHKLSCSLVMSIKKA